MKPEPSSGFVNLEGSVWRFCCCFGWVIKRSKTRCLFLTCPPMICSAPMAFCNSLISSLDPVIREVPVSTMPWQLSLHNFVELSLSNSLHGQHFSLLDCFSTVILHRGEMKVVGNLYSRCLGGLMRVERTHLWPDNQKLVSRRTLTTKLIHTAERAWDWQFKI